MWGRWAALGTSVTLLMFASLGCGARTGLTFDEGSSDADLGPAPDVFGPFPCTFSPVGEAIPITEGPYNSSYPTMEYGEDRLGILFDVSFDTDSGLADDLGYCYAIPYTDEVCSTQILIGDEGALYPHPLAWNGNGWGMCNRNGFFAFPPDGPDDLLPLALFGGSAMCTELISTEAGYIATWFDTMFDPMQVTIARLDALGIPVGSPLHEHALSGTVTQLAADDGMEIAAWPGSSWLVIRRLDGDGPHLEVMIEAEGEIEHLDIALRRPIAGVLWSERRGGIRHISFRLVDMERGQLVSPVELSQSENVVGLDVVAVNEGFVTAWSDFSETGFDRVVAIPIGVDGWNTNLYSPIVLHHELHDPLFGEYGGPSLAYDNRAVFVTFTRQVPSTGRYQVHFQQLDCHR